MIITFNGTTLVDDTDSPKITGQIERIGGEAAVQSEPLYNADNPANFARKNVRGQFVFTSGCSYADFAGVAAAFAALYALLLTTGDLVLTYGAAELTFASAKFRSLDRTEWTGVRLGLRYVFEITTVANTT
jgi:hypothetical protein